MIEDTLQHRLVVFAKDTTDKVYMHYRTTKPTAWPIFYLYLENETYYAIANPNTIIQKTKQRLGFCNICLQFDDSMDTHVTKEGCTGSCKDCLSGRCGKMSVEGEHVSCRVCRRTFTSKRCYEAHMTEACSQMYKCKQCDEIIVKSRKSNHVCFH